MSGSADAGAGAGAVESIWAMLLDACQEAAGRLLSGLLQFSLSRPTAGVPSTL